MVCSVIASCEKDKESDKEIQYNKEETTKPLKSQTDDPNNGYGDIITPNH
jgi:hypothetical protein